MDRGIFDGFSLPVYAANNEELFYEFSIPVNWKGVAWEKLDDVGTSPGGMSEYLDVLYIPMGGDNTVWGYDGTNLGVVSKVGDDPRYTTVHAGKLYISNRADDTIWVYDGITWAWSGNVGDKPMGMVSDGTDLYVACFGDDEIWRLSGGVWAVDPALGLGGVAGAVGTSPRFMAYYGGDVYVGASGADDDVWIRTGGVWAKDADVGLDPSEFQEHDGDLYLNTEGDDLIWRRTGGVWAVETDILTTLGNAPIGLAEYDDSLFSASKGSIWSDKHTLDIFALPFWNVNSDFSIVTTDEPMFLTEYNGKLYTSCYASDTIWVYEGETVYFDIHVWITNAQIAVNDAFRLQISHEQITPDVDVVPLSSEDVIREIKTGIASQYQLYEVHVPADLTGAIIEDSMAIRLRRIASSDEIVGEVVVHHMGMIFKMDSLGSPDP